MAGSSSEESGVSRSLEGLSNGQQRSGEALAEWRSSEQVENGITSTSPPYWDTDDDDDCGPKPSELYGKYTWKIDKFSQINKRELRSNAFEVGGYKWYILIYPQGCDVCNHLSLFLCVANHDKLLPGWSHFAQFTIAVVNKDPKKSKYSDTLHRFWKKEHDWGWKKFMELSKVLDGFVDADTLIIKAQVQVIRERADRPFRCLDCQYRRELVRVYLSNVEQICRRFVEERRGRLGKLIEDKVRWSSFCGFWSGIDQNSRRRMSREKSDSILKVVVKHFFIEKEVTSTLVMDSLYSGLKALEGQSQSQSQSQSQTQIQTTKSKKAKGQSDTEEPPVPVVRMENDTFILVDDVLLLLERAALEPLPPKDEKGPQNRTKDGGSGEDFSKDSIERDERRLTELGRRTIEIFVLAHIFSSKIEVAYQEAVALKRQEELIREEEEAWMAESEQKAKRGVSEKEKKSKKKQAKQKRNNRKSKEKEKAKPQQQQIMIEDAELLKKPDYVSDVSDSAVLRPDSDDRDSSPVNWDTDTSEPPIPIPPTQACTSAAIQNGDRKSSNSIMDDSSSTCSTDSLPSVVIARGKIKRGSTTSATRVNIITKPPLDVDPEWLEPDVVKKPEEVVQKKANVKDDIDPERNPKEKTAVTVTVTVTSSSPKPSPRPLQKPDFKRSQQTTTQKATTEKPSSMAHQVPTLSHKSINGQGSTLSKPVVPPMSRPLSAPLVEVSRPNTTVATPMVQPTPLLSRSASAAGYLGSESYIPSSYRNAMMGSPSSFTQPMFQPPPPPPPPTFGMMNLNFSNGPHWEPNVALADEFPHLDIINDLLDDEYTVPVGPRHHLSHQYSFPGEMGGLDPSTSSCRFERTRSYHEEFQHGFGAGGGPFEFARDVVQVQPGLQYVNGSGQGQWGVGGSDVLYGLRNMDVDGYQYHMGPPPDYSMGVNGYGLYRPNGQ
ncbi:hypothetical protein LXL04_022958 [Taraxacum kok-saghyz]